jgi:hypothetical protein
VGRAWAWETAFFTTTAVGWSGGWRRFGAFDFYTGFSIDAPRIAGATAALEWVKVASGIALGSLHTDWSDWTGEQSSGQSVKALSTCWITTSAWRNSAAFGFRSGFWVDAEFVTARGVGLDHLVETERSALRNISANQAGC